MILIQLTGLSGAGKTTLANFAARKLQELGLKCTVIDGDEYRKTLCRDLGFSKSDRIENIRRLGEVGNQLVKDGCICIIAAINPFETARYELVDKYNARTVWVNCSMEDLIKRDTKGLYKRALLADDHPDKLFNLTGVNDVFEEPLNSDLIIETHFTTITTAGDILVNFILSELSLSDNLPVDGKDDTN